MKLYSYSEECVTAAEVRWISIRFVFFSAAGGIFLLIVLLLNTPLVMDFHPGETTRLEQENAALMGHLSQISTQVSDRDHQLSQLKERNRLLNFLLHDRTMFGDSIITNTVSLTALRQHAFTPMRYAAAEWQHNAAIKDR